MKIVVIGGAGRVGAPCVSLLQARGIDVLSASRRSGADLISGAGLDRALAGAEVVVDVANAPTYEGGAAQAFFETAARNLIAAERAAGVAHHVGVSVVGAERLSGSGYFRGKLVQEDVVRASGRPFTVLRTTPFFELLPDVVLSDAAGGEVRVPPARVQFVAAKDVAAALAELALARPLNGMAELAGPDPSTLDALVKKFLASQADARQVIADPEALYFGARLTNETLMAGDVIRFGHTDFETWLRRSHRAASPVTPQAPSPRTGPSSAAVGAP